MSNKELPRIPPHEYRNLVNELEKVARTYKDTEQLREQIAYAVGTYLEPDHPHTRKD